MCAASLHFGSDWLYRWQTLLGAALGGIVGLLAALLVAYKNRRHDENVAAMTVLQGLNNFLAMAEMLEERAKEGLAQSASQSEVDAKAVNFLVSVWAVLPALFEPSAARILNVDTVLSVHLSLFLTNTALLSRHLEYLQRAAERPTEDTEYAASRSHVAGALRTFRAAEPHARAAVELIPLLFQGLLAGPRRFARYVRLRLKRRATLERMGREIAEIRPAEESATSE